MAASWVEIANMALVDYCGLDPISALSEAGAAAQACQARLAAVADAVLRAHPWNCAIRRAALAPAASVPAGGSFAYPLPVDPWCLRPLELVDQPAYPWCLEGRSILTDLLPPLTLRFVARITDPLALDALTAEAIGARLAAAIAYKLTGSREKQRDAWGLYEKLLRQARSIDGLESPPAPRPSSFVLARM